MTRSERAIGRLYGKAAEYRIPMTALAEAAGITRVTLSNWRSGRTIPGLELYLAADEALDALIADKVSVR